MTKTKDHIEKHRRSAAYREAGHAVIAWHRGILLESISIHSRKRRSGGNVWVDPLVAIDPNWVRTARPDMLIERLALISLAGPIAERRYSPRGQRPSISKQRIQNADALLRQLVDSRVERVHRRRQLEAEAEKLLGRKDLWEKTTRLAAALFEHKTLSGKQALKLIEGVE